MMALIKDRNKREALLFPFFDILLNGFNFLIIVYISLRLGNSGFSIFSALIALASVLFIAGVSLQLLTAKSFDDKGQLTLNLVPLMIKILLSASLMYIFLMRWLQDYLRASALGMMLILALVNSHLLVSYERGKLQGRKRFRHLNISFYIEVLGRIAVTVILLSHNPSYEKALLALIAGMVLAWLHGRRINSREMQKTEKTKKSKVSDPSVMAKILIIAGGNGCIYFLTNITIITVNQRMPEMAGIYSLSTKFSQLMLAVAMSIVTILLPMGTDRLQDTKRFNTFVKGALVGVTALLWGVWLGYLLILPVAVPFIYPETSKALLSLIPYQSMAYIFFGGVLLLVQMEVARERKGHLLILGAGAVLLTVMLNRIPMKLTYVIFMEAVFYGGLLLITVLNFFIHRKGRAYFSPGPLNQETLKGDSSMKKRLLFLSWRDIRHRKAGGAEVFTHEMLSRLDGSYYEITHLSPGSQDRSGNKNKTEEMIDGVHYQRRGNTFTVIFWAMYYYWRHHRDIDYVIDQCNTHRFFTPLWVAKRKRIFFIHQMTKEIWTMNLPWFLGTIGRYTEGFMTWIYRNSHLILTVSDSTKKDLMTMGCKEGRIVVLPEGISFTPWSEKLFEKKEEGLFTYVGRYSSYKGINDALEAFCRIYMKYPQTRFQVIGRKNDDYIREVLEPIRKQYEIPEETIQYMGFVSEKEKLRQMSRSQCLIFPSMREGWGLTITEAAAVGTPSIVYRSPGLVDAVDHGRAGYMTGSNNVFELQKLMEDVVTNRSRYERVRHAAYTYAGRFNWDNTSRAFSQAVR